MMKLEDWLERKYLEWQFHEGRRTLAEFAEYLNIPRPLLSHYMNGRAKPKLDNIEKLANKLGPGIYDLMGYQRPDPSFKEIRQIYDKATEVEKTELKRIFRDWATDRGYVVKEQRLKPDPEK